MYLVMDILTRMKKSPARRSVKTPVRRLERRDAAKHINYDAASSSGSAADYLSISSSSLMSRCLDRTSFRIFGGGDGEIEQICRSLGISGPDDLAITFEAWEACKKRPYSDVINGFNSLELDNHHIVHEEAGPCGDVVDNTDLKRSEDRVVVDGGTVKNRRSIERTHTILVESRGYLVPNVAMAVGGGGTKVVRPPVLKPHPALKRPPIYLQGSSCDFLTQLGPINETIKRPSASSSSDDRCNEEEVGVEEVQRKIVREDIEGSDSSRTLSNTSPIYPSGSIITSWQKGLLLGRGSFGSVYEGISGDGDFFAVKEVSLIDQGSQAQECIQQLEGEIALLSKLQHPNIVRYRGTAKDESNLYIFLELVTQGSLLRLYRRYQLGESIVSLYTRQILDGLKYLHDMDFIHRDIKCANILVDASGGVKLADFGLAKVSKLNDIKSCKGTPFWMAPEVINLKCTNGYGSSADIWSLGCTVLEMLTGQIPYCDLKHPVQALYRIGKGVLPEIPEILSPDTRDFILKCLKVNPEQRPTAGELLNHPFMRRPLPSSCPRLGSASSFLPR